MADTRDFEVVIEASEEVLRKVLRGAWKSAECPVDPGPEARIPEFLPVPPGTEIGGYVVEDGQIEIPQEDLDVDFAPDVNGAELKFGLLIQLQIQDPPVPSASLFDMTADLRAKVPIGTLPDSKDVYLLLEGLPRGNVSADLTSGDPLAPKIDTLMAEFVHARYESDGPAFPHTISEVDQVWPVLLGSVTVDVYGELYDDPEDPAHRIEVSRPDPSTIEISIPMYLRIFNIRRTGSASFFDLLDPMGIETRLIITAPFLSPPGSYTAQLSAATVTTGTIAPAAGEEGSNYSTNKINVAAFIDLDAELKSEIEGQGQEMATEMGDLTFEVPTVAEIEQAIGDLFHADLEARGAIPVWQPEASSGGEFDVDDVAVRVSSDALIIALNAGGGANINAITNFIPSGAEFAIALSAQNVNETIDQSRTDSGLADSDLPTRIPGGDKEVDLNELDVSLVTGAIRLTGEVTVIDAILGSIDVDADFEADVQLQWVDNPDGTQKIDSFMPEDPDISPHQSVLFWIISIILAVLTGGIGAGIIVAIILIVVTLVVDSIATSVGGEIVRDEISGAVAGIGAWPTDLARIGNVTSHFINPIGIDATGLVLQGTLEVISSCEATDVVSARSGAVYSVAAASSLTLTAGNTHPDASYQWRPGDGSPTVGVQDAVHTYVASGIYVAKHGLTINQDGGATSRHFALVDVKNVAPEVDAGADITVKEGEVVTLIGHFRDVEYLDTHESSWIFGDAQKPQAGTISETNTPPVAVGTSTVQHAWCDNGEYTVTFRVRDQNGGMGVDTFKVKVLNVAPKVDAGPDLFAYPCTPLTLVGQFEDPGWCDTHTGTWDLGDCTEPQTAIIRETNEPPAARGTAVISHIYEACGTYRAICTVIDDDGAAGVDETTVQVVELKNAGFEGGFHGLSVGDVANYWEPFAAESAGPDASLVSVAAVATRFPQATRYAFACEQCIVHDGQRSQRILAPHGVRLGVYQKLGANLGWEYQVSAWYALREPFGGTARLGIDPEGGSNPAASTVVWNTGGRSGQWAQLSERVIAVRRAITIFLEVEAVSGMIVDGCFDGVEFVAVQPFCPEVPEETEEPEQEPESPRAHCVDFRDMKATSLDSSGFVKDGFSFTSRSGEPLQLITWGVPPGHNKLQVHPGGLDITLPIAAARVVARISYSGGKHFRMVAFDAQGAEVGAAVGTNDMENLQSLEIEAAGIVRIAIFGQEGGLYELCAYPDRSREVDVRTRKVHLAAQVSEPLRALPDPAFVVSHVDDTMGAGPPMVDGEKSEMPDRKALEISPAAWEKFDPGLKRVVQGGDVTMETEFDVLMTIHGENPSVPPTMKGPQRAAIFGPAFERDTRALTLNLMRLGVRAVKHLWISRAISGRMPLAAIVHAAQQEGTKEIILMVPAKVIHD